jgi:rhodanese-related sulfurtransferase
MNPGPALPTIDVLEAERRLREDPGHPLLVDVREANEFADVRAPGAVLLPMSAFAARAGELPKDRPLMIVCHLGGRSAAAAAFLLRSGWPDVVNVAGGMDAWERGGLPIRRGAPASGEGELAVG